MTDDIKSAVEAAKQVIADPMSASNRIVREIALSLVNLASRVEKIEAGLADAYRESEPNVAARAIIAGLCDTHLDPSGALLGRVRERVRNLSQPKE
jgi:hypothetical protein